MARRWRVAALVTTVWLLLVGVQIALARNDALAGRAATVRATQALGSGIFGAEAAEATLRRAQVSFASASARLRAPFLQPMLVVPVVGRQLRSFTALTAASTRLTDVGATELHSLRRDIATAAGAGPGRVEGLRRVAAAANRGERVLAAVELGPEAHLLPSLASARSELENRVVEARSSLQRAGVVTDVVADLLAGPSRYLVLIGNNAEMRAGSGMFLTASTLESRGGSLVLGPVRSTADLVLPDEGLEGPSDLQGRWGWLRPGREWRNLGVSPRFEVTGQLAARMWQAVDGTPVDGVLGIDVEGLRALIAATGPVEAAGTSLDAGTVVEYLLHGQYVGLPETGHPEEADQQQRRDQLGELAAGAIRAVEGGSYDVAVLASELARAASGRHLLVWSADPRAQQAWETAGTSGTLEPDSLLVAVLNRGGNKLDRFLEVSPRLIGQRRADGTHVTIEVVLANQTPLGEPGYVAGPHPLLEVAKGDYLGIVSVNVPGSALEVRMDGSPPLVADGPDGPSRVIATPVLVPAGATQRVMVRFRLPAGAARLRVEPSARIPPQEWRMGSEVWEATAPRRVEW
ncbi:MAG: DUF4012 domain-containing protein [Actinobacteria bacterium]|nr:DUF4012 domain-containing protein [Actinomycetota bacterium]